MTPELFRLGLHLTPLGKLTWNLDRLKWQNPLSSGSTMICRPNRPLDSPRFLLYLPKSFFPKVWGREGVQTYQSKQNWPTEIQLRLCCVTVQAREKANCVLGRRPTSKYCDYKECDILKVKAVWINWSSLIPPTILAIGFCDFIFKEKLAGCGAHASLTPQHSGERRIPLSSKLAKAYRVRKEKLTRKSHAEASLGSWQTHNLKCKRKY